MIPLRPPLLTKRLLLRDIVEEDGELLFELDSDPEVLRYIGPMMASDPAGYRERTRTVYIPMRAHAWHGVRMVFDRWSGEFLGWAFARPATGSRHAGPLGWTRPDEVEIGYRYRRSAWGRGIATEAALAFAELALADPATSAIVGCVMKGNLGSLRVLEKLGMKVVDEVTFPGETVPTIKLARYKETIDA